MFYLYESPTAQNLADRIPVKTRPALKELKAKLAAVPWERKALSAAIGEVLKSSGLKMPELAMPVRLIVTGRTQTPSLDVVLELIGRDKVLARLAQHLQGE